MLLLLGVLFALLICIGALLSYSQQSQITALSNDIKALKKQLATQDFSGFLVGRGILPMAFASSSVNPNKLAPMPNQRPSSSTREPRNFSKVKEVPSR